MFFASKLKWFYIAARVRGFVSCCECGKRRVVYSSKRLTSKEENALKRVQEELLFVCGSVLFPGGEYQDTIVVKEGQSCNSPIEVTYYAGCHFLNICQGPYSQIILKTF